MGAGSKDPAGLPDAEGSTTASSGDDGEDAQTNSTKTRYWATNDALAFVLVFGYIATLWAFGSGYLSVDPLPPIYYQSFVAYVGIAMAWAFGGAAVRAWKGK